MASGPSALQTYILGSFLKLPTLVPLRSVGGLGDARFCTTVFDPRWLGGVVRAGNLEIHGFGMSGFGLFGGSTGCWFRFLLGMLRTTPVLSEASPVTETTPLLRIVHRRPPSGANRPLFQLQLWKDITPFAITGPQPPKPHHSQSKHALDKTWPQMSE